MSVLPRKGSHSGFLSVLTYGIPTHVIRLGGSYNQNDRCSLLRCCLRSRDHSFVGWSVGDEARKIPPEADPKRSGAPSDLAARVIFSTAICNRAKECSAIGGVYQLCHGGWQDCTIILAASSEATMCLHRVDEDFDLVGPQGQEKN